MILITSAVVVLLLLLLVEYEPLHSPAVAHVVYLPARAPAPLFSTNQNAVNRVEKPLPPIRDLYKFKEIRQLPIMEQVST
jgi:hypothetical protein